MAILYMPLIPVHFTLFFFSFGTHKFKQDPREVAGMRTCAPYRAKEHLVNDIIATKKLEKFS